MNRRFFLSLLPAAIATRYAPRPAIGMDVADGPDATAIALAWRDQEHTFYFVSLPQAFKVSQLQDPLKW